MVTASKRVALARCRSEKEIVGAVHRALSRLDPPLSLKGQRCFLKVNLMKGASPRQALNTHPEVVRGAIQWARTQGAEPCFGDACGIPGHTLAAAEAAGYLGLAEEEGVAFLDLDAGELEPLGRSAVTGETLWVSRHVLEADIRITLPKLKTHTLMGFTGALKNQMGLLPGGTKARVHVRAPRVPQLARAILEINERVPFHAALLDATWALEGGGSRRGRPRWMGYVAASRDLLSMDTGACLMMGWQPDRNPLLKEALRGAPAQPQAVEIAWSGAVFERADPPFERPARDFKTIAWVSRSVYGLRSRAFRPRHRPDLCQGCGECERVCPTGAVERKIGAWIRWDRCIHCFACTGRCPQGALTPVARWYLRAFLKSRMQGIQLS